MSTRIHAFGDSGELSRGALTALEQWWEAHLSTAPTTSLTRLKPSVATASALPSIGNVSGDARIALDTDHFWVWDSAAWVDTGVVAQGPQGDPGTVNATDVNPLIDARTGTGKRPIGRDELVINPTHHGAVGNGTTDDTSAWQAAVNACPVGGTVDGLGKTYLVGTINFKSNMTVLNANFKCKASSADYVSPVTLGAYNDTTMRRNVYFKNVHVDGQRHLHTNIGLSEDGGRHGFRFIGQMDNVVLEDCSGTYCASDGLCFFKGQGMASIQAPGKGIKTRMRFIRCKFNWNRRHGASGETCTDIRFEDCEFNDNGLNADGTLTVRDTTQGANGAVMPGVNQLYGNGVDLEEYEPKDYIGDIHFIRCISLRNARESFLFFSSSSVLANHVDFRIRKGWYITGCHLSKGQAAGGENKAIIMTPAEANKNTGRYYDDVNILDNTLDGLLTLRSVKNAYVRGGTIEVGGAGDIGIINVCDRIVVDIPHATAGFYVDGATVIYAPKPSDVFIPARDFGAAGSGTGTPTLNVGTAIPRWLLHDGFDERVSAALKIPPDWTRVNIDLVWTPSTWGASGNVRLRADILGYAATEYLAATNAGAWVTATAGATETVQVTRLRTSESYITGTDIFGMVMLLRDGANAADTLAGNVDVLGVLVTRAG